MKIMATVALILSLTACTGAPADDGTLWSKGTSACPPVSPEKAPDFNWDDPVDTAHYCAVLASDDGRQPLAVVALIESEGFSGEVVRTFKVHIHNPENRMEHGLLAAQEEMILAMYSETPKYISKTDSRFSALLADALTSPTLWAAR